MNTDNKFIGEKVTSGKGKHSFDEDKGGKGPGSFSLLFYHDIIALCLWRSVKKTEFFQTCKSLIPHTSVHFILELKCSV